MFSRFFCVDEYSCLIKQKKTPNCQICKQDPNIKTDCNGHGPIGLQLAGDDGSTNRGIFVSEVAKGSATDLHNLIQPGDMVVAVNKTRLYLSDKLDVYDCVDCIKTSLCKSGEVLLTFKKDISGADHLKQRLQKREIPFDDNDNVNNNKHLIQNNIHNHNNSNKSGSSTSESKSGSSSGTTTTTTSSSSSLKRKNICITKHGSEQGKRKKQKMSILQEVYEETDEETETETETDEETGSSWLGL